MYGAQPKKLAKMLGISLAQAKGLYEDFWNTNWSLKALRDRLIAYWESTGKKYILGIDGRKVYTRSKHSLVNALFQSCGAIVMDYAGNLMYDWLRKEGLLTCGVQRAIYMHENVVPLRSNTHRKTSLIDGKPKLSLAA